jgi:iron complex outermembrane recepter protein
LAPYSKPSTSGGRQTCFLDTNDSYTAWGNGNDIQTIYSRATFKLPGDHVLGAEYNYAWNKVLQNNAPAAPTVRLNSTHPFYPGNGNVPAIPAANLGGRPIDALWSVADMGPRQREDFHTNQRAVLTLEGALAGWDYTAAFNYGWSERRTAAGSGWVSVTGLATVGATGTTLFLDPRLNPFGLQNAAGLALLNSASISGQTLRLHKATNSSFDLTLNRELFQLSGGPAQLAMGAELRKDGWEAVGIASNDVKASLNNQIDILGGDAQAAGATSATSNKISRNITSAFAELEMPVTKQLTANAALRVDRYADLGETTVNPKLGARWQPTKGVVIRGSANTGFRAPSLPEIYSKETERTAIPTFDDPLLCPTVNGVRVPAAGYTAAQVCQMTNRFQITKVPTNSGIDPEKSRSAMLGVAFEPWRDATLSIDYWRTNIDNVIGNRAITFMLLNPNLYTSSFRREADGTLSIDAVYNPPSNLGKLRGSGIDLSLAFAAPRASWGRITGQLEVSYLTKWEASTPEVAGGAWQNALGFFNDVVPVNPNAGLSNATRGMNHRWKHTAMVGWQQGPWQVNLSQRYQSKIVDQNLPIRTGAGTDGPRDVAAYEQYNLTGTWKVNKQLTIGGAIFNLFDRNPPLTNHNGYFGYLTSSVDVLGRAYRVTAEYTF